MSSSPFAHYLHRHAELLPVDGAAWGESTVVVVIPVRNEPDLAITLNSLAQCTPPSAPWIVLLVVNDSIGDSAAVRQQNQLTLRELQHNHPCPLATIDATALPDGQGGVGRARKIGMDAAVAALARQGRDGILLSLDGDCTVNSSYLTALHHYFEQHPAAPACVTSFCHPLDAASDRRSRAAVVQYELHLRYYRLGLKYAGVPYAFHTIGSCFACRASDYACQGGMSRREAGEDFYFLHKMAQRGAVGHCHDAVVYPSPRVGSRTPFGTGAALASWLARRESSWRSYHPAAFVDLQAMVAQIDTLQQINAHAADLPLSIQEFYQQQRGEHHLTTIRNNTASQSAFRKRFWHWFDGFMAMKFIRFACNNHHGWIAVEQAISNLLNVAPTESAEELLTYLRTVDSDRRS
ncbi:MAG: glycosyltransferase family A protein [Mariprofundales bacterium]|nr:glycosyltransferase family A protein [Mariprofundales bacterium]